MIRQKKKSYNLRSMQMQFKKPIQKSKISYISKEDKERRISSEIISTKVQSRIMLIIHPIYYKIEDYKVLC